MASGADTYSWNGASAGLTYPIVAGSVSQTTVSGGITQTGCSQQVVLTHSASALPTVSVSGPDSVCAGDVIQLVAHGAHKYQWNMNGAQSKTVILSPPPGTNVYASTGTDTLSGCKHTASLTVTAFSVPMVNVSGILNVCAGDLVSLSAAGAVSYTWMNSQAGSTYTSIAQPGNNIYFVKGTTSGICFDTDSVQVLGALCAGLTGAPAEVLRFFPNPVSNELHCTGCGDRRFRIIDLLGADRGMVDFRNGSVSVAGFVPGMYFITDGKNVVRFIVR